MVRLRGGIQENGGDGADQVEACVEGGAGGGGPLDVGAASDLSTPAGEEACLVTHLLIEGRAIDEEIDIGGRNNSGRLVGTGTEGKVSPRDLDRAFGHVRFARDGSLAEQGELGARLQLLDLIDRNGDGSGHIALEHDISAGHTVELARQLVTVGKDQDIRWRSWGRFCWSSCRGLRVGKRRKDEKG